MAPERALAASGLILGKFLPPHRGHQLLVEHGRRRARRLTVLVCSLAREPIPGELRAAWMRELFPDVNVVHVTDENPQEPHEHPRFWEIWMDTILRATGGERPEVVFTSEAYGDELARRLGARHEPVDPDRRRVPVSGTRVRRRPLACWELLPEPVRPWFVKRVAIVGAESTGKTTLARALAARFATVWVPEYARGYLDERQRFCALDDMAPIARGHRDSEEALARKANRLLVCDTDAVTTAVYSRVFFGECPAEVAGLAATRRYDLTLVTDLDVAWEADAIWQRELPHRREEVHARVLDELRRAGRPYALVSGLGEARLERAARLVEPLLREEPEG